MLTISPTPLSFKAKVKAAQSCPTLCDPMDYTVHGILQARILEWVAVPFSRVSSQPRDPTQVSCSAETSPAEPPGKPKNTGVDSLSLFQGIFPTEESNWSLQHLQAYSLLAELPGKPKGFLRILLLEYVLVFV